MESFLRDARYALRRLRLAPGFTATAAVIIGLGIGGNTAVFSIVNAVLLRPQPYERPEELVNIYVSDSDGDTFATASYPEFLAIRESGHFQDVIAFDMTIVNRMTPEGARLHFVESTSGNYWQVLGLRPHLGRLYAADDDRAGSAPVVVLGYRNWIRNFAADSAILGRAISLNGVPVTVIGIGPRDYDGVIVGVGTEAWMPAVAMAIVEPEYGTRLEARNSRSTWVRARLEAGGTVEQATAAMATLMATLAAEYPASNEGRRAQVIPAGRVRFHPAVDRVIQPVAAFLLLVVTLVLAIACSNLANLLLASASRRQREVAIRLALGADRWRLVRQFLVESVVLGLLGGVIGLGLAILLVRLLVTFQPPIPIPVSLSIGIDGTVLVFTAILALGTGILFGLAPALRASRPHLVPALKNDTTSFGTRHRRFGLRNVLVVSQVAGSLLLLVVAGLILRHLANSQRVDPGFQTERIAMVSLATGLARMTPDQSRDFYARLMERLAARPDVRRLALTDRVPLGTMVRTGDFAIDGFAPPPGEESLAIDYGTVSPGYFDAMEIPIVRGRDFSGRDDTGAMRVAIVSEAMARTHWSDANPIGRLIRWGGGSAEPIEVIGVARDTRVRTLGEAPRPYIYLPVAQHSPDLLTVLVATTADPRPALNALRTDLATFAPEVPVFDAKTMPEHLQLMLFLPRVGAGLVSLFGALAMILAMTGLYGVVAFAVTQRTREIGIRVALGAKPGQVTSMVVREGLAFVGVGAAISLLPSLLLSRVLSGALYQVDAFDAPAFLGAGLLFGIVAFLASWIPARRAARIDPLVALRHD